MNEFEKYLTQSAVDRAAAECGSDMTADQSINYCYDYLASEISGAHTDADLRVLVDECAAFPDGVEMDLDTDAVMEWAIWYRDDQRDDDDEEEL